jgi:hypothetical protein
MAVKVADLLIYGHTVGVVCITNVKSITFDHFVAVFFSRNKKILNFFFIINFKEVDRRNRKKFCTSENNLIIFSLPFLDRYFLQQRTIFVDLNHILKSLYILMPNVKDQHGLWEDFV